MHARAVALRVLRAARAGTRFPPLPAVPDPAQVKNARAFAGTYRAPGYDDALTVAATARDRLALVDGGTQHPLLPVGDGVFWTDDARFALSGLRFVADHAAHRATALVAAGRWYQTASYRGPGPAKVPGAWEAYAGHYRYPGAHPYDPSIRVQLVHGALVLDDGTPLNSLPDGSFRIGSDSWGAERLRFDTVVDDHAQRATYTGIALYRVTTP